VNSRRWLGALATVGVSLACVLAAPRARADSVDLLDLTATVYGNASNNYSFETPGAGTVWVSTTDVDWPEAFQSLSTSIVSSHNTLAQLKGTSMFDVTVSQASMLYASIAGIAGNTLGFNVGMYSLHVGFVPAGEPVPLPETFRLLLVGLGFIGAVRLLWKRAAAGLIVGPPLRNESVTCTA
jgi:hypothetical protein